jgi:sporulation protein YlmC with PRC-barrel domain
MLTNLKTLKDYRLNANDGEVGGIKEFLFDDKFWTIRYLVVNTGNWLSKRRVLLSPYFIGDADHRHGLININLLKEQIENSPSLDNDQPVSRQYEESYYGYYGAPVYWSGSSMWGSSRSIIRERDKWNITHENMDTWNSNLISSKEISGYDIRASNGQIGDLDDFILDDENWAIRYLAIDTKSWLPGKKVLISPEWIQNIREDNSEVQVNLSLEAIKDAPAWDEDQIITRDYETKLFNYYGRKGYWLEEPVSDEYSRFSR